MKVYFISGLGADESVFKYIHLQPQFQVVHLNWIEPQSNESLQEYALRMAERIDRSEKFGLVGLSLGGMVATEIARAYHAERIVLISSIPLSGHLPFYFKWAGVLHLHRIVPIWFLKKMAKVKRVFTTETSDDKKMLRAMIDNCDAGFMRWAFHAALSWKNDEVPENFSHIHGTRDEVLPIRFTKPGYIIENAGHLLVMTRAKRVNEILEKIFS